MWLRENKLISKYVLCLLCVKHFPGYWGYGGKEDSEVTVMSLEDFAESVRWKNSDDIWSTTNTMDEGIEAWIHMFHTRKDPAI